VRTLLAAVTAGLVAAGAAGGTVGQATSKPSLRVLDRQPLVLRGSSFVARERLVLYAASPERTIVRRLTATRAGTFVARFAVGFGGCTGVRSVRVVGTRSGSATIRSGPMTRECPPPPTP
jgi:hypothetical protein